MTYMNTSLSVNVDSSTAQALQIANPVEEQFSQKPAGIHWRDFDTRSQIVTAFALLDAVEGAHTRIAKHVIRTPTIRLPWLDRPGLQVWAKLESQQHSGSFKYRGAINALSRSNSKFIITASVGNHG
jgi:threonine synthase